MFALLLFTVAFSSVPTPPSFVHAPNPRLMYFVMDSTMQDDKSDAISLRERRFLCEASAYPPAKYHWTKNGQPLDLSSMSDRVVQVPGEGSFVLSRLLQEDEGVYQCVAQNGNGSAFDREIILRRTFMSYFPKSEPEIIDIELGDPFEKSCLPPPSEPKAKVFWIFKGADGGKFQTINSTSLAINNDGTLFGQYANLTDQLKANMFFTCTAENTELKDYKFGHQFRLNILKNKRKSIEHIPPYEQYVSPPATIALRGESVELFCIFAGYPDLLPEWRKVNGNIDMSRVNWVTNFRKSLRLDDVTFADEGVYECLFPQAPELNRRLNVQVHAAPYWEPAPPNNQNSSEGETVEMECSAGGRPEPVITFYKNGRKLPDDPRYALDGKRFIIRDLKKGDDENGDNAVYQCKAENEYGYVWANFYLNILSFPATVLEGPGDQESVVGQKATLRCRVFGSPKPKIEWQSPTLSSTLHRYTGVGPDGDTHLMLLGVDKKDEGLFECRASNKYGQSASAGSLIVRDPTRLYLYPANETVTAGQRVQLPCKAYHDSSLEVNYSWLVDGVPIDRQDDHYKIDVNYTLIIDNPTAVDSAEYTCVAESRLDKAERSATVLVKDVPMPPFFLAVTCTERNAAVRFQHRDRPRSAAPVESFWVHYRSNDGEPDAWQIYPVPVTTRADKDWWTILIPLHPFGNFTFRAVARNEVGDSAPALAPRAFCTTLPAKPDVNPVNVRVGGSAPDNLVVSWDPVQRQDWNGPDFHYLIEYRSDAEGEWNLVATENAAQPSLTVQNQPTYRPYDVRVYSANALGRATVTPATVSGHSGEGYPTAAPQNFQLISIDAPSVATFSWDPVEESTINGNFKGYKIVHWHSAVGKRSADSTSKKETLFDRSATHGTIYDLKPFRVNYAEVYASNDAYDSPPSAKLRFEMPEGVPSAVQDLSAFPLSHREVGVTWKPPYESNGQMIGYNMSHCLLSDSRGGCVYTFYVPEVRHERLTGLRAESAYRVQLRALTNAGAGDPVSVDVRTLPEGINKVPPSEPSLLETGASENEVNVTWIPGQYNPENPTPVGDKFYFKYRVKGTDQWEIQYPDGDNFTVSLNDLYPGTVYEVKAVSVVQSDFGGLETESPVYVVATSGRSGGLLASWLIAVLVAVLVLVLLILIIALLIRCRGAKYPVSAKEKEQGREPMLKDNKGFGEYYPDSFPEDRRSLTGASKGESESDSMAEYGDNDTGQFKEDGSFIGQYAGQNSTFVPPGANKKNANVSTFV